MSFAGGTVGIAAPFQVGLSEIGGVIPDPLINQGLQTCPISPGFGTENTGLTFAGPGAGGGGVLILSFLKGLNRARGAVDQSDQLVDAGSGAGGGT